MFTIFNDQGFEFRSTLENIYQVKGITPVKNLKQNGSSEQDQEEQNQSSPFNEAITAYRKVVNAKREEPIYHASQIMKRPVITVQNDIPVAECYQLIEKRGIKQLPVLNDDNNPVGLITKESLLKVLIIEEGKIRHSEIDSIKPIVSQPMITADPVADIRRVARVMYDHRLNCIPITNDANIMVGIITRTDIIHAVSIYPVITLWA